MCVRACVRMCGVRACARARACNGASGGGGGGVRLALLNNIAAQNTPVSRFRTAGPTSHCTANVTLHGLHGQYCTARPRTRRQAAFTPHGQRHTARPTSHRRANIALHGQCVALRGQGHTEHGRVAACAGGRVPLLASVAPKAFRSRCDIARSLRYLAMSQRLRCFAPRRRVAVILRFSPCNVRLAMPLCVAATTTFPCGGCALPALQQRTPCGAETP